MKDCHARSSESSGNNIKGDQPIQDKAQIEEVRVPGCLWYLQTWRLKPQQIHSVKIYWVFGFLIQIRTQK